MLLYPQLVSLNNRILHAHVLESAGDLLGEAGHAPQTKQLDRPLEAVGVGGLEEVEVRVPGHSDALQHDHGPGDEGEVVRYEEGVGVEDLVQVEGHGPELRPPPGRARLPASGARWSWSWSWCPGWARQPS